VQWRTWFAIFANLVLTAEVPEEEESSVGYWTFPLTEYVKLKEKLQKVDWNKIGVDCFLIPFEVLSLASKYEHKSKLLFLPVSFFRAAR
jgi:hypothetical protein